MEQLSHINEKGEAAMVSVVHKATNTRKAAAGCIISFPKGILPDLHEQEILLPKGALFQTAKLAGIMGVKRTADLIPLCHPINLDHVDLNFERLIDSVSITCTVQTESKTGVEMEALTGCSVAALTVYDMCKALTHDIIISEIKLLEKTGGKRDFKR